MSGPTTGGFIALHHVWKLAEQKNNNKYFKIDKLLLVSPLTRFYFGSIYMDIFIHILNNFISLFTYRFNYGIIRPKNNSYSDEINNLLKSIYIREKRSLSDNINIRNVLSDNDDLSILSGYVTITEKTIKRMINSKTKIDIPVRMVCSNRNGADILFNNDSLSKPEYIIEDITKICNGTNFKYEQFECGHDAMCEPYENYNVDDTFDEDNISYVDIMNYLFEVK